MAATQSTSSVYKPSDPNKAYPLLDILKDLPPGWVYLAVQATREVFGTQGSYHALLTPELQMYCDNDDCQGTRFFGCIDDFANKQSIDNDKELFLHYRCRNCRTVHKTFALYAKSTSGDNALIVKLGQWSPFLPGTPARVLKIFGPDLDLYYSGRRAEAQGVGIGAFAYYRKVVDNQRRRLLDEIGKAARRIGGHNPLTLLYAAISHHLHSESSVRLVLTDLAERLDVVLKDKTASIGSLFKSSEIDS